MALVFWPTVGLHAFWNVFIPVAPALFVFGIGIWRNICPMASNALFLRHIGRSKRKPLNAKTQLNLQWASVWALLIIVPLRHVILDTNGLATAIVIGALALLAIWAGRHWEWKSAWCSGLCPVHPVEKLYGLRNAIPSPNAHCTECEQCVEPCPDSTAGFHLLHNDLSQSKRELGALMVGGFPGFIWGWFHVPNWPDGQGWSHLTEAYGWPFFSMLISYFLFSILRRSSLTDHQLARLSAAAGVSLYYWYRIPALFGHGLFPGDGMLIDLSHTLPSWFTPVSQGVTTAIFFWWLVVSRQRDSSWSARPPFSKHETLDSNIKC
jgi:NAD-dependent dihydropyrimidine dehydrogenase PreA subunit